MKVISLAPSTTEILYALDAGDMIVGNTYLCDYPQEAKKKTKVGSFSHVDVEKIQALQPDIIFTSTVVQQRMYRELTNLGLHVVHIDPRSVRDILASIQQVGELTSKQKASDDLVRTMKKEVHMLEKSTVKVKPRAYVE